MYEGLGLYIDGAWRQGSGGRTQPVNDPATEHVFTRDAAVANEISSRLKAGMVGINTCALAAAETPFGGVHDSGFGREGAVMRCATMSSRNMSISFRCS